MHRLVPIMRRLAQIITRLIDFFYPPFRRIMSPQLFRYAACGGGNMLLDWLLYFIFYNFVVGHELVYCRLPLVNYRLCLTPHIASLCIVFPITLLTGFLLQKYVTFGTQTANIVQTAAKTQTANIVQTAAKTQTAGQLHGWRQLGRYTLIVFVNLAINYFGLKLCVEIFGWYPTPSKMAITLVTVAVSYIGQKYYTFSSQG